MRACACVFFFVRACVCEIRMSPNKYFKNGTGCFFALALSIKKIEEGIRNGQPSIGTILLSGISCIMSRE